MRACIVGGGVAGSLLAWRLAQAAPGWTIDLVVGDRPGDRHRADATAASGGAVRAYEPDPEQRRLATASMAELLASETLRRWADYREVGFVYLRPGPGGLAGELADIESALPGSARVATAGELAAQGWAGVPAGAIAVLERRAGYISPVRLREAVLADGALRRRVTVTGAAVGAVALAGDRVIAGMADGSRGEHDVVVLAAGAWTGELLRASGLPADGYRTKSIQYSVYPAEGWRPAPFFDELTGLYGRPTADGGMLLGLPTDDWDVDPDRPPTSPDLHEAAVGLARARFPSLRLGPLARRVGSADSYTDPPILSLRPVDVADGHRLYTFAGGSGGAAKTALAASQHAATQLVELGQPTELASVGRRKGQR